MEKTQNSHSVQFTAYNMNREMKEIDILSESHPPHTGITNLHDPANILKNDENNIIQIEIIRMMMPDIIPYVFNGFYFNNRKQMYMKWFSPYQYQKTILQIPLILSISKTSNLKFEIPPYQHLSIILYPDSIISHMPCPIGNTDIKEYHPEIGTSHQIEYCSIIRNHSGYNYILNLFDGKYINGYKDEHISVEMPLNDKQADYEFHFMKIVAFDTKQLGCNIKCGADNILPSHYISCNYFQECVIDVSRYIKIRNEKGENEFTVNVLPHTEVMYYMSRKRTEKDHV